MNIEREQENESYNRDQPGQTLEKAANEFAGALKLLGFQVTEVIRMGGGMPLT
jgi:hypothetical protein